jgi:hypothetical protein
MTMVVGVEILIMMMMVMMRIIMKDDQEEGGGHNIIVPLIINPRTQFLDSDMKNLLIRMYENYSLIHLDVVEYTKMPGGMPNVVDCMRRHVLLPRHYCPSIRTIVDDCSLLRHVLVG